MSTTRLRPRPRTDDPAVASLHATAGLVASTRIAAPLARQDVRSTPERALRRRLRAACRLTGRALIEIARDASVVGLVVFAMTPILGPTLSLPTTVLLCVLGCAAAGGYQSRGGRAAPTLAPAGMAAGLVLLLPVLPSGAAPGAVSGAVAVALAGVIAVSLAAVRRAGIPFDLLGPPRVQLGSALVVGRKADAAGTQLVLAEAPGHRVHGVLAGDPRRPRGTSRLAELEQELATGGVEEVLVVSPLGSHLLAAIAGRCWRAGVRCFALPDVAAGRRAAAAAPGRLGQLSAFELLPTRVSVPGLLVKRVIDVILTLVALVVAVPLSAAIAAAIRLDSPGPAFFRQRRVGLGGREFTIWKFRSMHVDGAARRHELEHRNPYGDAPLFKLADDPRITRVGRLLRRTSLDELPQLVNVLRGEMSLVGPRPPLPEEVARYAPQHLVRLSVVPGITGPWQVGGRNLITDFERIVTMEREYIERWTLGRDLSILVRTVGVVIRGTGAY